MAVKLQVGQIVEMAAGSDSPVTRLSRAQGISASLAYRVGRILKALVAEMESYEAARQMACQKYGTADKAKGEFVFGTPEKRAEFNADFQELLKQEVSLDVTPVVLNGSATGLTPADLLALEPLVTVAE